MDTLTYSIAVSRWPYSYAAHPLKKQVKIFMIVWRILYTYWFIYEIIIWNTLNFYLPLRFLWKVKIQYFSGNRFLAQPNVANIPQPNVTNKPGPIEVVACEFYIKDNAKAHRTEDYDLLNEKDPSPVLRRGQPFRMAIRFNRPFNVDSDSVTVELTLGKVFK